MTTQLTTLGCGGATAVAFTPASVANLMLWFSADVGTYADTGLVTPQTTNGGTVEGWADQSGNANNATKTASSCTLTTNAINGLPVIAPGLSSGQLNLFSNAVCSGAFSIYVVGTPNLSIGQEYCPLSDGSSTASVWLLNGGSITSNFRFNSTGPKTGTVTGFNSTSNAVMRFRVDAGGGTHFVGTGMTSEAAGGTGSGTCTFNNLFFEQWNFQGSDGTFGEIILVGRDLAGTTDDTNIRTWLSNRWGLTFSGT